MARGGPGGRAEEEQGTLSFQRLSSLGPGWRRDGNTLHWGKAGDLVCMVTTKGCLTSFGTLTYWSLLGIQKVYFGHEITSWWKLWMPGWMVNYRYSNGWVLKM